MSSGLRQWSRLQIAVVEPVFFYTIGFPGPRNRVRPRREPMANAARGRALSGKAAQIYTESFPFIKGQSAQLVGYAG